MRIFQKNIFQMKLLENNVDNLPLRAFYYMNKNNITMKNK